VGIPEHPGDGQVRPEPGQLGQAEGGIRAARLGQAQAAQSEQPEDLLGPGEPLEVEQQGPAGVGIVGGEHLAPAQVPHQPGVDGAGHEPAGTQGGAGLGHLAHDPGQLAGGEVGIQLEPGDLLDPGPVPGRLQFGAQSRAAPVLPHQGVVHRQPGHRVPGHHGLALVGDSQGGRDHARGLGRGGRGAAHVVQDLHGVVLHPAGGGVDLPVRQGGALQRTPAGVEHQGLGGLGALVDGQHVAPERAHHAPLARAASSWRMRCASLAAVKP
jgi:hypothetical protein